MLLVIFAKCLIRETCFLLFCREFKFCISVSQDHPVLVPNILIIKSNVLIEEAKEKYNKTKEY